LPVVIDIETKKKVDTATLLAFAKKAHKAIGLKGDLAILITGDAEMKRLNRQFRKKNKPTDVISFPASLKGLSGDLAISADIADKNAGDYGHTLTEELQILLLHGMLHLAGWDHEADGGKMATQESKLRGRFGLRDTLIGRAQSVHFKGVARPKVRPLTTPDKIGRLRPARRKSSPKPKRKP
jgi:probable rRNA maturation factor